MQKNSKDAKNGYAITSKMKAEERTRIERIAEREQRPLGSMFRILAMQAATTYEQSLQSAIASDVPTKSA